MIKFRFLISLLHEDEVFQNNVDDEIQDDITVTYTKKTNKQKRTKIVIYSIYWSNQKSVSLTERSPRNGNI